MRITDPKQLESVAPHVRAQLEGELDKSADQAARLAAAGKARAPSRCYKEEAEGRRLMRFVDGDADRGPLIVRHPGLGLVHVGDYFAHIPNGGARSRTEAAIFVGQGVRPGWPDYALDLPFGGWHGFRLELKAPDGDNADAAQLKILARLEQAGYRCAVSWGADQAIRALLDYCRPMDPQSR